MFNILKKISFILVLFIFMQCDCSVNLKNFKDNNESITTANFETINHAIRSVYRVTIYDDEELKKPMIEAAAFGFSESCDEKESFFALTAGHICNNPENPMMLYNTQGEGFKATIIIVEKVTDLCLLKIRYKNPAICLAKKNPVPGERVILIGNYRYFFPTINEAFVGIVTKNNIITSNIALPGTSGSMLINKEGKLIDVLSSIRIERFSLPIPLYEHGGIFSSLSAINRFVRKSYDFMKSTTPP